MTIQIIPVDADITPENKCSFCKGSFCCTYTTQAIDTPRSKKDYTNLLWQISHEHVSAFKDGDGWFLLIEGRCTHLQANGRCGIYESRPHACREHDNDYCEFDEPLTNGFELYFPSYDSLLQHCRRKFKNWDGGKGSGKVKGKKKAK